MRFKEVKIIKSNITSSLDLQPTFNNFGLITRQLALQSSKYIYRLQIYDFQAMKKSSSVDIYQTYNELKHFIKFVADYNIVAINTIYEIRFYQIQPLRLLKNILHQQQNIYDLQVSTDGELVVLVGQYIKIWRTNGFRQITFPQVITSARYCAFSNDNKYMAVTSNFQINIYTFNRVNGTYIFNQISSLTPPVINGDVTSIQFNPNSSNQLIVGFLNVSPQLLNLDTGLFVLLKDIQPKSSLNAKKAQFMPDGKRVLSSDYVNGIGIWPGVNNTLYYQQGYLLYDLRSNRDGTSVLGYVWQQVKLFNIQVQCSPQNYMKICPCNPNQHWDYYSYNCQPLQCLQSEFATGQIKNSQCVCVSGYTFNPDLGKCQIDCSIVPKAITVNPNTKSCYCKQNLIWDSNTKSCKFDCSQIPNSSGVMLSSTQCQCNAGFIWSSDYNECICPAYMKEVAGQCVCYDQYYPNDHGKCIIDCSIIANQNGSLPSQQQCQCQSGHYFTEYNQLVGCKLNCTNFNDTLTDSPGFSACLCNENMHWVNNTCNIVCTNVQYASGASTTVANGCNCAVNYLWINQIHECGKNCSGVANVNQSMHSTLIACPCINNFNWNQDTQKCQVDCTKVNNTNPYSLADPTKCQCRQAFDWIDTKYKCQINCSKIWGTSEKVSDYECTCKSGTFNQQKLACESTNSSSLFSSPLAIVGFVVSIIVFIIIMLVLIRFCWQFQTKNNKEHQKKLKVNDKQPFQPNKKKRLLKSKGNTGTQQMITDERLKRNQNNNAYGTVTTL